jgi:hypothetical protein
MDQVNRRPRSGLGTTATADGTRRMHLHDGEQSRITSWLSNMVPFMLALAVMVFLLWLVMPSTWDTTRFTL